MKFTALRPDEFKFSLTAEFTLKEWAALRDQLKASELRGRSPAWEFIREIDSVIDQASKDFYPRLPPPSQQEGGAK